jgi:hypothetical protein
MEVNSKRIIYNMEKVKSTNEINNGYGVRICNLCNELFFIESGKQRYAIQKEEAYHRKIICMKCWKDAYVK